MRAILLVLILVLWAALDVRGVGTGSMIAIFAGLLTPVVLVALAAGESAKGGRR